jgi:membrane protein YdbS with pleckstrin-like domain
MSSSEGDRARLREGAERRLHPWSWLFVLLAQLKEFAIPLLALLFFGRGGDWQEAAAAVAAVVLSLVAVLRYYTYRFRIDAGELVIRDGVLQRQVRHLPLGRITNIALRQNPLHRLFGVAEVRLESATGGNQAEAQMRVLALRDAEALEALIRADAGSGWCGGCARGRRRGRGAAAAGAVARPVLARPRQQPRHGGGRRRLRRALAARSGRLRPAHPQPHRSGLRRTAHAPCRPRLHHHRRAAVHRRLAGAAPARGDRGGRPPLRLPTARQRREAELRRRAAHPPAQPRAAAQDPALDRRRTLAAGSPWPAPAAGGNRRRTQRQRGARRRTGSGGAAGAGTGPAAALGTGCRSRPPRLAAGASARLAALGLRAQPDRRRHRAGAMPVFWRPGAALAAAVADPGLAGPARSAFCRLGTARRAAVLARRCAEPALAGAGPAASPGAAPQPVAVRPPCGYGRPARRQRRRGADERCHGAAGAARGGGAAAAGATRRRPGAAATRARSSGSAGPARRTPPGARATCRRCPARPRRD